MQLSRPARQVIGAIIGGAVAAAIYMAFETRGPGEGAPLPPVGGQTAA